MTRSPRAAALAAALSLLVGCTPAAPDRNYPVITLIVPPDRPEAAVVDVSGLGPSALAALRVPDVAAQTVRVDVLPAGRDLPQPDLPQVAGRSVVVDSVVRFTPSFPFDPGARYRVVVDTARLPGGPPGTTTSDCRSTSRVVDAARATVTAVTPGGAVLPENLLRLYVHFSAPMGRRGGGGHVRLLDADGREVVDPFLPLEAELWNGDRTRYTLFLDPGRVKTGIRPNDEMGRALVKGRRYTLEIDADWRDAYGRPLAGPFRHEFRAGPAIETALDPDAVDGVAASRRLAGSARGRLPARAGPGAARACAGSGDRRWRDASRDRPMSPPARQRGDSCRTPAGRLARTGLSSSASWRTRRATASGGPSNSAPGRPPARWIAWPSRL